jgi:hypothetical protein
MTERKRSATAKNLSVFDPSNRKQAYTPRTTNMGQSDPAPEDVPNNVLPMNNETTAPSEASGN